MDTAETTAVDRVPVGVDPNLEESAREWARKQIDPPYRGLCLVLFGSRTFIGRPLNTVEGGTALDPVYQIEIRNVPQQVPGPNGQPQMILTRQWYVFGPSEFNSITSPAASVRTTRASS